MATARRLLGPLTAIWLCCQIGTVAFVPAALWVDAADPHGAECTCGHGDGAICPMHHKPSGRTTPCSMRSVNDSGAAVLTTLMGITGLMPAQGQSTRHLLPSAPVRTADTRAAGLRPVPPDPPPPRA